MPRNYKHIQQYEKEIIKLRNNGYTEKQIYEKLEFSKKQYENFITTYNKKQAKFAVRIVLKRKGDQPKIMSLTSKIKFPNSNTIRS